jgi:hypothetical protein
MALRERGPTAINGRRPRSGRVSDRADPEIRCGDHIPNMVLTSQIKEEHFTLVPERNQALQRFSWIREHFPIEAPRSKLESDAAK